MILVPLFFVVLIWYLIICYKWKKNIFDHIEKIPGIKWRPIFGTTYPFVGSTREDVLYKFVTIAAQFKPFFRTWNGDKAEINIMKPDHLQVIMRSSAHTTKGSFYDVLFPWLGEGLFISEGAKWFLQRKLLTPTFHFKILEGFMDSFNSKSHLLVDQLNAKANGEFFNVIPLASKCTLEIICETAMGVPLKEITDDPLAYVKNVHEMTELAMWRYWRPYFKDPIFYLLPQGRQYRRILRDLQAFSAKVITYKKQVLGRKEQAAIEGKTLEDNALCRSFLDIVMEATDKQNIMSDSDLKSLVDTFLLAGYETTANTISWALFLLGNAPEIQEKAFQEVRSVLGDKASATSVAQLNELTYLDCIIKETLRLFPVLPFITRRLTETVKIDEYTIPSDTQAILHVFQVQRDPDHFPDPNNFDPDRFLPENAKGRHPFAYIPFSAGPRNCLGVRFAHLELRSVLSTIINKFKVTSLQKPEEIKLFAHVLLRSQSGIDVKMECRD